MGRSGQYIMSKNVLTGLTRRYGSIQCKACGEPIKERETVNFPPSNPSLAQSNFHF